MKNLFSISVMAVAATACASRPDPFVETQTQIVEVPYGANTMMASVYTDGTQEAEDASLWTNSPNALLSMRRAKAIGDLLTVVVEMNDQASVQSSLSRSRDSSEDVSVDAFFGLPEWANGVLPGGASLSPGVDLERNSALNGSGAINRAEQVEFRLSARVVGVEPNGNLIIQGFQQTQVSNEVRYLTVSGVIRAQDITRTNMVSYEKIADAKLSYVSSKEAGMVFEQKAGSKFLERVVPF